MKKPLLRPGSEKTFHKQLYLFLMTVFAVSFFLVLILSGGYSMRGLLAADRNNSFMDFFNKLILSGGDPYAAGSLSAPFALLFYRGLLAFVPQSLLDKLVPSPSSSAFSPSVKIYQQFYFPFILYAVVTLTLLFFALRAIKKGSPVERFAYIFLTFLSAPMLFAFERGCDVVLTLALTALFFAGKNSESKIVKNLAMVSLGFACAFSFYPLLFLLPLLKKKRFWDAAKVFLVCLVLTAPAVFVVGSGIEGFGLYFSNVINSWRENSLSLLGHLSFSKSLVALLSGTSLSAQSLATAGDVFAAVIGVVVLFGAVTAKKEWQQTALICVLIAGISPIADTCSLVFFAIPAAMLMDCDEKCSVVSCISLGLVTLTQALIPSPDVASRSYTRLFITRVTGYGILVLAVLLAVSSVISLFRDRGEKTASGKAEL